MKRKKPWVKLIHPDKPWTPWIVCDTLRDGVGNTAPVHDGMRVLMNNQYTVQLRLVEGPPPFHSVMWLSIRRTDRRPLHDWRDLQRIKNDLVGPEVEAVELYPAESRLVDTTNQYQLWAFVNGWKFPYGFRDRLVMTDQPSLDPRLSKARQRPFRSGDRPSDITTPAQADAMLQQLTDDLRSRTSQHDNGPSEPNPDAQTGKGGSDPG